MSQPWWFDNPERTEADRALQAIAETRRVLQALTLTDEELLCQCGHLVTSHHQLDECTDPDCQGEDGRRCKRFIPC